LTGKNSPKHHEIFEDLEAKKRENPAFYAQLHEAMTEVYSCREPEEVLQNFCNLSFKSGYSVDLILKNTEVVFHRARHQRLELLGKRNVQIQIGPNRALDLMDSKGFFRYFFSTEFS